MDIQMRDNRGADYVVSNVVKLIDEKADFQ